MIGFGKTIDRGHGRASPTWTQEELESHSIGFALAENEDVENLQQAQGLKQQQRNEPPFLLEASRLPKSYTLPRKSPEDYQGDGPRMVG